MKTLLFLLLLSLSQIAQSQYYYNDITGTRELTRRMKDYAANKVKTITATGYDKQGVKTSDFNEWQEVNADQYTLKITTRNGQRVTRQSYQFDSGLRLLRIIDSSTFIKSVTVYSYDGNNNLISIKTGTEDQDSLTEFSETEERQWSYNAAGQPNKMLRIVNSKDSSEYRFTIDEKGNITDEELAKRRVGSDTVYYYYDDARRLTDIVRYNKRAKQLLPDIMFEYDDNDRVIQKITPISTINPDYLIWRFIYNDKGLKTKEALFNKQKELTGRIDYVYGF